VYYTTVKKGSQMKFIYDKEDTDLAKVRFLWACISEIKETTTEDLSKCSK